MRHSCELLAAETPKAERDFKAKLIGTEGARLLREKRVQGRPPQPQAQRRRGRTARGKRVPEVEINVYKKKGSGSLQSIELFK
ncbi:hypothetical protein RCO48_20840 [Peribacillus frigoritolerans]|nr:hypothetical protein [Peribacillus frigoritolerans]